MGSLPDWSVGTALFSIDRQVYISDAGSGRLWRYNGVDLVLEFELASISGEAHLAPGPEGNYWLIGPEEGPSLYSSTGALVKKYPHLPASEYSFFIAQSGGLWYYKWDLLPTAVIIPGEDRVDNTSKTTKEPVIPVYIFHRYNHPKTPGISFRQREPYSYHWKGILFDSPFSLKELQEVGTEKSLPPDILALLTEAFPLKMAKYDAKSLNYVQLLRSGQVLVSMDKQLYLISATKHRFDQIQTNFPIRGVDI